MKLTNMHDEIVRLYSFTGNLLIRVCV